MRRSLNMIGAGRAGRAFAAALIPHGVHPQQILTRSPASAAAAAKQLGAGTPIVTPGEFATADWWLVATPDDQLTTAAALLKRLDILTPRTVVFHLSGLHSSHLFHGITEQTASAHPLCSFAGDEGARALQDVYCALEGPGSEQLAAPLRAAGAYLVAIDPNHKVAYHAAGVVASNYVTTLLDRAVSLLELAGIEPQQGTAMVGRLARSAVDNATRLGAARALTGPISRGDTSSVAAHLRGLPAEQLELYATLGLAALDLALSDQRPGAVAAAEELRQRLHRGRSGCLHDTDDTV